MKTESKDKTLSRIILVLSGIIILYGIGISGWWNPLAEETLTEYYNYIVDGYLDFILIGYLFICLQIAGYVELKYKQDYITISIVCIFLSPISLFFIKIDD
jgi:hypothetical protein